jgi:predicted nucleic acid-binding Zn finger protein
MIFSLLCKDEWFLMVGFHHCPPMAGNVVFEGTKMSLRGLP